MIIVLCLFKEDYATAEIFMLILYLLFTSTIQLFLLINNLNCCVYLDTKFLYLMDGVG